MGEVFPKLSAEIQERVRAIRKGRPQGWRAPRLIFRDPRNPHELTLREVEVLALIADGLTDQEIADRLIISVETVKTHVKHILQKTETLRRSHAVAYGFRNGILT